MMKAQLDIRTLFWVQDSVWRSADGGQVDDRELLLQLDAARQSSTYVRAGSLVYYPVTHLKAVIELTFTGRVQRSTIDRAISAVEQVVEIAELRFKAERTILTGLINKATFIGLLERQLAEYDVPEEREATEPSPSLLQAHTASVIAIDLDSFKQVNDNYGHEYGDVVLKTLGMRLTQTQQDLAKRFSTLHFELAHLSGEEFALLVVGRASPQELRQIAEGVRECVASTALPTTAELKMIATTYGTADFPHESDRRLTISVGVAAQSMPVPKDEIKLAIQELMKHADEAMYRAKTAGRNRVCFYTEILTQLGRVLEYDPTTKLVAIDIGSNVGVRSGQEFYVYDSRFFGATPFVYSDGRTKKKLGMYPQHAHARIVARYVQKEVSFCESSEESILSIQVDSRLHAVPLGALNKMSSSVVYGAASRLSSADEIQEFLRDSDPKTMQTIAFALSDSDRILRNRGEVTVNRAVEHVYDAILATVAPGVRIAQVPPVEFVVAGIFNTSDTVAGVLAKYAQSGSRDCRLKIGTFDQASYASLQERNIWDKSQFNPDSAVDLARYASSVALKPDQAASFTPYTASEVLYASRRNGQFRSVLSDFDDLTAYGMDNALAYNQAALSVIEGDLDGKLDFAIRCMNRAVELDPGDAVYLANRALVYWHLDNEEARNLDIIAAFKLGLDPAALRGYTEMALRALFDAARRKHRRDPTSDSNSESGQRRALDKMRPHRASGESVER
jgi:diguanylate cyclase (GGDEF)-like protein